jgi:hypothetical protein
MARVDRTGGASSDAPSSRHSSAPRMSVARPRGVCAARSGACQHTAQQGSRCGARWASRAAMYSVALRDDCRVQRAACAPRGRRRRPAPLRRRWTIALTAAASAARLRHRQRPLLPQRRPDARTWRAGAARRAQAAALTQPAPRGARRGALQRAVRCCTALQSSDTVVGVRRRVSADVICAICAC